MLQAVLSKENLEQAFRRVMENKGACGVDGVGASTFRAQLQAEWETIKGQIESRSYKPRAVKRVLIPKPNGDKRPLGIPTYMDRFIQQSISQILTPIYDPDFSGNSFGFRSERNAQQAAKKAQSYINEGYSHVVDIDLAKFFDKVNHDYLMNELSLRIQDKLLLRLIHLLVRADIQEGDKIIKCKEGLPQGGPLSPLLSNIILDKLDKELEALELQQ